MNTTRVTLTMIVVGLAFIFLAEKVFSHSWYDLECCTTLDCRPISGLKNGEPWSEITDKGNHYIWKSSETGFTHMIEKSSNRIRPSRDGFYHGCEVTGDLQPDAYARCLYVPALF